MSEPPAADRRQSLGRRGEAAAAEALERSGLSILDRRYRKRCGEIDLVAEQGELLVFVEVKSRSGTGYGAAEAVTRSKQRKLVKTALCYLAERGMNERPCRFDVVEVTESTGRTVDVHHIEDAFRPAAAHGRPGRFG